MKCGLVWVYRESNVGGPDMHWSCRRVREHRTRQATWEGGRVGGREGGREGRDDHSTPPPPKK
jgi:hypothetical protein